VKLLLVRHGETLSNIKKIYAGKGSESLTKKGIHQAIEVGEKLRSYKVHALYSSPIERALQTAKIIGDSVGLDVIVDESFREMDLGIWEGLSENDIYLKYPEEWKLWKNRLVELKLPGRETLEDLLNRVLVRIKKNFRNAEKQNVLIVTHVAVIRVLLLWQAKKSLNFYKTIHVPNAEVFEILIDTYL
jgi:alpha-ribazole phosphatase/probable phosphoglycerate mutase